MHTHSNSDGIDKTLEYLKDDFEGIFDKKGSYHLDALLTPTTPSTAFELGAVYGNTVMMQCADQFTVPANHAGIPGISIPAGFDQTGLPIGIQLLGPDYREDLIMRIGHAYEQATQTAEWRQTKPRVVRELEE